MNESARYHLTEGNWKEKAEELRALALRPYVEMNGDAAASALNDIQRIINRQCSEDTDSEGTLSPLAVGEIIHIAAEGLVKKNEHARYNELISEILTFWDLRWSELKEIIGL